MTVGRSLGAQRRYEPAVAADGRRHNSWRASRPGANSPVGQHGNWLRALPNGSETWAFGGSLPTSFSPNSRPRGRLSWPRRGASCRLRCTGDQREAGMRVLEALGDLDQLARVERAHGGRPRLAVSSLTALRARGGSMGQAGHRGLLRGRVMLGRARSPPRYPLCAG
jgi:hypothetical protein